MTPATPCITRSLGKPGEPYTCGHRPNGAHLIAALYGLAVVVAIFVLLICAGSCGDVAFAEGNQCGKDAAGNPYCASTKTAPCGGAQEPPCPSGAPDSFAVGPFNCGKLVRTAAGWVLLDCPALEALVAKGRK